MKGTLDYYLSLNSPWTYLGHDRLVAIAERHGVAITVHPVDLAGIVFPATGGLPLPKRSPERQAYRLLELARWRRHLGCPLNIHPRHWPVDERLAAHMVVACREAGDNAVRLAGAFLRAVWAEERDIADVDTAVDIATENGLDGAALADAAAQDHVAQAREADSRAAVERGVFGAPSYIYGGALFWGQDRLDFVEQAMEASRGG